MMPPPWRSRRPAAAVETPGASGRGWLSVRRRRFKREERDEYGDDGLPLSDEALLAIFSGLPATEDLVRCAATCRRWQRLVSADAAFICGGVPRSDRFIRRLALGFFHNHDASGSSTAPPPRFVPFESPSPRQLSLSTLVDDGRLLDSSRVVASRNGRLVLELRRTKAGHILRLCVCNPMTGDVDFLPPLRGNDAPGPYACAVLTAADEYGNDRRGTPSSYRVLIVYNRRRFTALRCYSAEAASWDPEAKVTGARIGRKRLGVCSKAHPAVVHRGVVFWPGLTFGLQLSTLQPAATNAKLPYVVEGCCASRQLGQADRLVGVMPDGRLCVVEADETIRAYFTSIADAGTGTAAIDSYLSGRKEWQWTIKVALIGPECVHRVKLRWFLENSGVVLFTAKNGSADSNTYVYTVDVETKQVVRVAGGESFGEMCGYEMDRVALLASLAR